MTGAEGAAVARLGWRTARREWRRTTLVVLLVAVPVALAILAAALMRAGNPTPQQQLVRELGQADLAVTTARLGEPARQRLVELLADLPPTVQVVADRHTSFQVDPAGTRYVLEVTDTPVDHPVHRGRLELVAGRPAAAPDEATITSAVASIHQVGVGDRLDVDALGSRTVTGIVEYPGNLWLTEVQLTPSGFDQAHGTIREAFDVRSGDRADNVRTRWSVAGLDVPSRGTLTDGLRELALDLEDGQLPGEARPVPTGPLEPGSMTWAVADSVVSGPALASNPLYRPELVAALVAGVMLAVVAFVAATAYATGARRRLRELGLLTANGATPAHVRLAMLGEAGAAGVLGAGAGLVMALAALTFASGTLQRLTQARVGTELVAVGDVVGPAGLAVVAALAAAWRPATTAARVPPTVALQGRMPLTAPSPWVAPLGLVGVVLGGLAAAVGLATNDGGTGIDDRLANAAMILGVVGTIGGAALLTGPIIAALGRRVDRLPTTLRLVVRDAARQRTRAAAATSAAMALLLIPVLVAVNLATMSHVERTRGLSTDPRYLLASPRQFDGLVLDGDVPTAVVDAIAEQLPAGSRSAVLARLGVGDDRAAWITTRTGRPRFVLDGIDRLSGVLVAQTIDGPQDWARMAVARLTDDVRRTIGIPDGLDAGVVVLGTADRDVHVRLPGGHVEPAREVPAHVPRGALMPRVLVSADVAARTGLAPDSHQALFRSTVPIAAGPDIATAVAGHRDVTLSWDRPTGLVWPTSVLVGLGVSALLVLVVLGLVMARSATESDHDLGAMVAMGAPTALRRRFLGLQAGLYALVGATLATPLALGLTGMGMSDILGGAIGPLGVVQPGEIIVPAWPLVVVVLGIPLASAIVISLAVRSAPVRPPRRIA